MKRTIWLGWLVYVVVAVMSIGWTMTNEATYSEPILQLTKLDVIEEERVIDAYRNEDTLLTERIEAVVLNGERRGETVTWTAERLASGALDPPLAVNQKWFVQWRGEDVIFMQLKRDVYVAVGAVLFVGIIALVGRMQGVFSLISFACNATLLYVALHVYTTSSTSSLVGVVAVLVVSFTFISLIAVSGWHLKTVAAIVSTFIGTVCSFVIVMLVLRVTNETGIYYEEMQFLTRPYRAVFFAGLLIGSLGAVMDVSITIVSSLFELYERGEAMTRDKLLAAGRAIGHDVMGTITSILFFAYVSGSIPMMLLYFMNDVPVAFTLSMNTSLELTRALAGGIGIVLTVPISLYVTLFILKRKGALV